MYACLPSDLNPIFCVRLFVFVFRLMDVEHSQPPTHAHAYINTYAHTHTRTNWSDGSGSERAMHAKGRRTQSLRQKGVAVAVRALLLLLLLLLLSRKNNKCTNTLRTHTNVPMLKWDLLLLYAITVAFFFVYHTSNFLQRQQFYNIFTSKSQKSLTHTHEDTLYVHVCSFRCSLLGPSAICKLVLYTCVCACVLCVTACMCVCSVVASAIFLSFSASIFRCFSLWFYIMLMLKT